MIIPSLVIYHGPGCADGFTAAWSVYNAIGDSNTRYIPANYGEAPPDVTGEDVAIVDFSYPRGTMTSMAITAKSMIVLDHHVTSEDDLRPLLESKIIDGVFDKEHSGAWLAWDWFHPLMEEQKEVPPPKIVRFVEDYDLWKHQLEDSKAINAFINSFPKTFENWTDTAHVLATGDQHTHAAIGYGILRTRNMEIENLLKQRRLMNIAGYVVPVVNCSKAYGSEVGNRLLATEPKPHFAATYYDYRDHRSFSLRSSLAHMDVEKIAKLFGGGGHRNASGFSLPHGVDPDTTVVPARKQRKK